MPIAQIAKYKIKEDKFEDVIKAIKIFLSAIEERESDVLSYEAYYMENKTDFFHIMTFRDSMAEEHHKRATHTIKFVETLYPLCSKEPEFTGVTEVV